MKTINKLFICLVACILTMLTMMPPVFADLSDDSSGDNGYSLRDNNPPQSEWNLATQGQYNFSGEAAGTAPIYSLYRFTGVNRLDIRVKNLGQNYTITVKVKKWSLFYPTIDSFTVAPGQTRVVQVDVNSSSSYFLSFSSPCYFEGWII